MNETERIFISAAELVKSLGKARLSSGRTLEEALTIRGVSLWDVISPSFAVSHVSAALGQKDCRKLLKVSSLLKRRCLNNLFSAVLPVLGNSRGCRQWPQDPAFIFMGFSNYMFRETLLPVAEKLSRQDGSSVVVLNDSLGRSTFRSRHPHIIFSSIWGHWDAKIAAESHSLKKDLRKAVAEIKEGNTIQEALAKSGRSLFPILENTINCLFDVTLPLLLNHVSAAKHMLVEHRPRLIIAPDVNDPYVRIYTLLAKQLKIPTLDVQLGFSVKSNIEWQFFLSDHLAVNGEGSREVMEFHGIPPQKITVTGSPRYDLTSHGRHETKRKIRLELKLPEKSYMLVFASQPYVPGSFSNPEIRIKMLKAIFKVISGINGLSLLVKPHPLEDVKELKSLVGTGRSNIKFAKRGSNVQELISASDAFISFFSTTIFDSLAMNKPTIVISFPNSTDCTLFTESGAVLVARSEDDIRDKIKVVMSGVSPEQDAEIRSARDMFLKKWLYKVDGNSTERLVSLALKIADPCRPDEIDGQK